MSFILTNNTKYSLEKLEAWIFAKQQGKSLMEIQFSDLNLNINSQKNSWNHMDVKQAICKRQSDINLTNTIV